MYIDNVKGELFFPPQWHVYNNSKNHLQFSVELPIAQVL